MAGAGLDDFARIGADKAVPPNGLCGCCALEQEGELRLGPARQSALAEARPHESRTHFAETLRYMLDGVRNSAEMEEKTGTRLGGFGELAAAANTSRTVSRDGWTPSYCGHALSSACRQLMVGLRQNLPEEPCLKTGTVQKDQLRGIGGGGQRQESH